MTYYDDIATGYNELHKEEQLKKLSVAMQKFLNEDDYILDVGCGTGFCLDYFTRAVGIDPSKKLLEQYKGKHKVVLGVAEDLPFTDKEFDAVLSLTAAQNFSDMAKAISEMKRVSNTCVVSILKTSKKVAELEKELGTYTKLEQEKDFMYLWEDP